MKEGEELWPAALAPLHDLTCLVQAHEVLSERWCLSRAGDLQLSLVAREAVAVDLDKVDCLRAVGHALHQDLAAIVGQDSDQSRGDRLVRKVLACLSPGAEQFLLRPRVR